MELIKFDEMKKTWHKIARYNDGNIAPDFELEIHKKLLNTFHVGEFYYYICNIAAVEMEWVSDSIIQVLGLQRREDFTVEYIYENIHPDDKNRFAVHELKVTEFFNNLPPDKILKYKVSYDYRMRRPDGKYIWILMQTITIQAGDDGAVIRVLGVQTNISHLKSDNTPSGLSFIGLEGEPSYYNVPVDKMITIPTREIFTNREKEIIRAILAGHDTKKMSSVFNISVHTVNTHRKNILRKSDCKNWIEFSAKAFEKGWL